MANGITSLLDVAGRALAVHSQVIRVIGNNVANVNTPGYSRREAELVTVDTTGTGLSIGEGVDINTIERNVDSFVTKELRSRTNALNEAEVRESLLQRIQTLFSVDGEQDTIGSELTKFFDSLEDLRLDPANTALRSAVIAAGESLTQAIRSTFDNLAAYQREADTRVEMEVSQINNLSQQIAELNSQIVRTNTGAQQNLGLLDKRDSLLAELAGHVSIQVIPETNGAVNVTLENGFGLVTGFNSRALEFSRTPSFAPVGGFPKALDGGALGFIVYDFDESASDSHIDLTRIIAAGGGTTAGLLEVRGVQSSTDISTFEAVGDLPDIASRVEAIARDLLVRFNATYRDGEDDLAGENDEDAGTAGYQSTAVDLDGNTPSAFGLFSLPVTAAANPDADTDGLPESSDLDTLGLDSYARLITFNIGSTSELAAALDLDPVAGAVSFAPGDARNIVALLSLREKTVAYSVGNFSVSATIEDLYHQTVADVGLRTDRAESFSVTARERATQVQEFQANLSGVSIDEEFAKLVNYQRAYEASARLIRVGDQLLAELIQLVGR